MADRAISLMIRDCLASQPSIRATMAAVPDDAAVEAQKKFKDLLDMGAITQEEFDAKKKQLLGL